MPVKAEWIRKKDKYHKWYECSNCGMRTLKERPGESCPHCKADMTIRERRTNE